MLLNELFKDSKRTIPWHRTDRGNWGSEYQFPFKTGQYDVAFHNVRPGWYEIVFSFSTKGDSRDDIVGTGGSEFAIFATIVDIIRDAVEHHKPEGIRFSAKEPSRQRLYQRFAAMLNKNYQDEHMEDGTVYYVVPLK